MSLPKNFESFMKNTEHYLDAVNEINNNLVIFIDQINEEFCMYSYLYCFITVTLSSSIYISIDFRLLINRGNFTMANVLGFILFTCTWTLQNRNSEILIFLLAGINTYDDNTTFRMRTLA